MFSSRFRSFCWDNVNDNEGGNDHIDNYDHDDDATQTASHTQAILDLERVSFFSRYDTIGTVLSLLLDIAMCACI